MAYNWEQPDWPNFPYDLSGLQEILLLLAERTGHATGLLQGLTPDAQVEASVMIMVAEALKTSAIEGELLSRKDVMSSIRRNLGLETGAPSGDKRAQGAAALMLAVRNSFESPLSEDLLLDWHRTVMTGHRHVATEQWRSSAEPMQVGYLRTDRRRAEYWIYNQFVKAATGEYRSVARASYEIASGPFSSPKAITLGCGLPWLNKI